MATDIPATPGPWTVEEYGDDETPALVIHKGESRICFMATPGSGDPAKIEANAHLISAAPVMLAALKNCIAAFELNAEPAGPTESEQIAIGFARAAIAKAEGDR